LNSAWFPPQTIALTAAVLVCRGVGGEFQMRRQPVVRLGVDLPDYIPLPSSDVRRPSCCDVLSTTLRHHNVVDDALDSSSPEEVGRVRGGGGGSGRLAMSAEILRQLRLIAAYCWAVTDTRLQLPHQKLILLIHLLLSSSIY